MVRLAAAGRIEAVGLLAVALACASCSSDYVARRDTLSPGSGDAVQAAITKQVVDPRPRSADRVGGLTDGEFLQHAIERYENPAAGTQLVVPPGAVPVVR